MKFPSLLLCIDLRFKSSRKMRMNWGTKTLHQSHQKFLPSIPFITLFNTATHFFSD